MPIDNIAFTKTSTGSVALSNFSDTVVVRLQVRDAGRYVVFGRVVIQNFDNDSQNANARLTTFDGGTELDKVDLRIVRVDDNGTSPGAQSISLQGTLTLPSQGEDSLVDIRCATLNGQAIEASLFAILVDSIEVRP